jgi:hypothetical protein
LYSYIDNWETAMQSAASAAQLADGQCGLSDGSKAGDWRLPTKDEWEAMVDKKYEKPALSNAAGTSQWTEGDAFSGVQTSILLVVYHVRDRRQLRMAREPPERHRLQQRHQTT